MNKTLIKHFPQCDNFVTADTKWDTNDTLCQDRNNTCAKMLETLQMSVIYVLKIKKTHLPMNYSQSTPKLACVQSATINMLKNDTLIS